jgi:SAM-dependent methyltransferase
VSKPKGVLEYGSDGVLGTAQAITPLHHSITPLLPFDALAAEYDAGFTNTTIGRLMRRAVWRRLDARFTAGDHILELNCGTGEDAVYLAQNGVRVLATDSSPAMTEIARAKAHHNGVSDAVRVEVLSIEDLTSSPPHLLTSSGPFDGVLSNFGGLNCVGDLAAVRDGLADLLRPDGFAVLCVMGPVVPWEWVWYLGHGQPRKGFRRLRRGGVEWRGMCIRYPSVRTIKHAFAPAFRLRKAAAVGALLPPPYGEAWANRHPRLVSLLNRWERRWESATPLPWLGDHYVVELERLP